MISDNYYCNSLNNLKKYFASFLLIFAFTAINGAEFFHHHDHGEANVKEDKCEACLFNHSLNTTLVEQVYVFTPQLLTYNVVQNTVNPVIQSEYFSTSPGRAPPEVSHI